MNNNIDKRKNNLLHKLQVLQVLIDNFDLILGKFKGNSIRFKANNKK